MWQQCLLEWVKHYSYVLCCRRWSGWMAQDSDTKSSHLKPDSGQWFRQPSIWLNVPENKWNIWIWTPWCRRLARNIPVCVNVSLIFHLLMHSYLPKKRKKSWIFFFFTVLPCSVLADDCGDTRCNGGLWCSWCKSLKHAGQRHRDTLMVQFSGSKDAITQRHRGERQEENQYIISAFLRVFPSTESMSQFTSVS